MAALNVWGHGSSQRDARSSRLLNSEGDLASIRARSAWLLVLCVVVASLLTACGQTNPSSTLVAETPTPTRPATLPPEVRAAVQFRVERGLRADPSWVRQVAADPTAAEGVRQFGIPLMPDELQSLIAAASRDDMVMREVEDYEFEHPDVWAGAYVDRSRERIVVLITDDLETHRAALLERVDPDKVLEVIAARWTLAELDALRDRIVADEPWLRARGAVLTAVRTRKSENVVLLNVSSARADIAAIVIDHFDAEGMLRVVSDGTGVAQMPRGNLLGRAVDAWGTAVPGLRVEVRGDIPGSGPHGDVGILTRKDGRFEIEGITATGYEVRLFNDTGPDGQELARVDWILAGTARVIVYPEQVTEVTITVASAP